MTIKEKVVPQVTDKAAEYLNETINYPIKKEIYFKILVGIFDQIYNQTRHHIKEHLHETYPDKKIKLMKKCSLIVAQLFHSLIVPSIRL